MKCYFGILDNLYVGQKIMLRDKNISFTIGIVMFCPLSTFFYWRI